MERHETAELFSKSTTMAIVRPTLQVPQISLIGLAGMISLLLLGARMLPAETAAGLYASAAVLLNCFFRRRSCGGRSAAMVFVR